MRQLGLFACEELAREVRARARLEPDEVAPSGLVARRLLGPKAVTEIPRFRTEGLFTFVEGQPRIFVRRGAPDRNFLIAHELGHWAVHEFRIDVENEEDAANMIGAAIVAPPNALRRARDSIGEKLAKLARIFEATQSMIWLRLGEVLGDERALVTEHSVRFRSAGAFPWYEPAVRAWARGRPPSGVRKAVLRTGYDSGRITLRAS